MSISGDQTEHRSTKEMSRNNLPFQQREMVCNNTAGQGNGTGGHWGATPIVSWTCGLTAAGEVIIVIHIK